jgi:succinate dehydrogenase / fumarate reductase membrane anchor subunit
MVSYRTPLARARGLGSAKHGSGHWVVERVTSIALVPLSLWAVCSGLTLARVGYVGAADWMRSPLNAVLSILLLAVGFKHLQGGVRVIIEDYMHVPMTRNLALLASLFVCTLAAALAIFCILKVAFGSAAIPA